MDLHCRVNEDEQQSTANVLNGEFIITTKYGSFYRYGDNFILTRSLILITVVLLFANNNSYYVSAQHERLSVPVRQRVILQPRKVIPLPSLHEPLGDGATQQAAGLVQTRRSSPLSTSYNTPPPFTGDLQLWTTADNVTPSAAIMHGRRPLLVASNDSFSLSLLELMLQQQHEKNRIKINDVSSSNNVPQLPQQPVSSNDAMRTILADSAHIQHPMATIPPPSSAQSASEVELNMHEINNKNLPPQPVAFGSNSVFATTSNNNNNNNAILSGRSSPISSTNFQQQQNPQRQNDIAHNNNIVPSSFQSNTNVASAPLLPPPRIGADEFHELQQNALAPVQTVRQQPAAVTVPPPPKAPPYQHKAMLNWTFTCEGRQTGYHANVEDRCQSFFFCDVLGNKVFTECPLGLQFNLRTQVCDWPSRAGKCPIPPSAATANNNNNNNNAGERTGDRLNEPKKMTKQGGIYRFSQPRQFGQDDHSAYAAASPAAFSVSNGVVVFYLISSFILPAWKFVTTHRCLIKQKCNSG